MRATFKMLLIVLATICTIHEVSAQLILVHMNANTTFAERANLLRRVGVRELDYIGALKISIVAPIAPTNTRNSYVKKILLESALCSYVEEDTEFEAQELRDQWGLFRIGTPFVWPLVDFSKNPMLVAVLDSGVSQHPDITLVPGGYDFIDEDDTPDDENGHGTRMAGVIGGSGGMVGVAPRTAIFPVRVLNKDGRGSTSSVTRGIAYAIEHGAQIINMSLAGKGYSQAMEEAVSLAIARGVIVVAAAGNASDTLPWYPAAYQGVIAVTATDKNDRVAGFSNTGSWISLAAPGVQIYTTGIESEYTQSTGTSPAAAFVSGATALLLQMTKDPYGIGDLLENTAKDIETNGWDSSAGWGRVDIAAAAEQYLNTSLRPDRRDRTRPQVFIMKPERNSGFAPGEKVIIETSSRDNVGIAAMELIVNNAVYAIDIEPPYIFVAEAPMRFRVRAYDATGNNKASSLRYLRVR